MDDTQRPTPTPKKKGRFRSITVAFKPEEAEEIKATAEALDTSVTRFLRGLYRAYKQAQLAKNVEAR